MFYYNKHVLEYITSILELDFSMVNVESIRIVGYYNEGTYKIF